MDLCVAPLCFFSWHECAQMPDVAGRPAGWLANGPESGFDAAQQMKLFLYKCRKKQNEIEMRTYKSSKRCTMYSNIRMF